MAADPERRLGSVETLRALAAAFERDELPAAAVRQRIAAAVREVEAAGAAGLTLDKALGLSPSHWRDDARRRRNDKIVEARSRFLADLKLTQAAARIAHVGVQLCRLRAADGLVTLLREAATNAPIPTSGREIENILRPYETTGRSDNG